jgi:hypothetical protein
VLCYLQSILQFLQATTAHQSFSQAIIISRHHHTITTTVIKKAAAQLIQAVPNSRPHPQITQPVQFTSFNPQPWKQIKQPTLPLTPTSCRCK